MSDSDRLGRPVDTKSPKDVFGSGGAPSGWSHFLASRDLACVFGRFGPPLATKMQKTNKAVGI
jgi:hypothetical protein